MISSISLKQFSVLNSDDKFNRHTINGRRDVNGDGKITLADFFSASSKKNVFGKANVFNLEKSTYKNQNLPNDVEETKSEEEIEKEEALKKLKVLNKALDNLSGFQKMLKAKPKKDASTKNIQSNFVLDGDESIASKLSKIDFTEESFLAAKKAFLYEQESVNSSNIKQNFKQVSAKHQEAKNALFNTLFNPFLTEEQRAAVSERLSAAA